MPNLSFTIGSLTVTPLFWGLVLAVFFSSFSIWKKLKEDFKEEEIFGLTLSSFFFALVLSRLIFTFFNFSFFLSGVGWFSSFGSNFSPAGAFWGMVLILIFLSRRFKKNLWEIYDSFSLATLYFLFLGGLGNVIKTQNPTDAFYVVVGVLGFLFYTFWRDKYRSWPWYKSGKIGFLFWADSFYTFLALLVLALLRGNSLYFEELSLIISLVVSLAVIYSRSERKLKEDMKLKSYLRRKNG